MPPLEAHSPMTIHLSLKWRGTLSACQTLGFQGGEAISWGVDTLRGYPTPARFKRDRKHPILA